MSAKRFASQVRHGARVGLASLVMLQMSLAGPMAGSAQAKEPDAASQKQARTPIQHVIVIVGENRTFDHIFATYHPKNGERVWTICCRRRLSTKTERRERISRLRSSMPRMRRTARLSSWRRRRRRCTRRCPPPERWADGRLQEQRDLLAGRCDVVGKRAGTGLLHLPDERGERG